MPIRELRLLTDFLFNLIADIRLDVYRKILLK